MIKRIYHALQDSAWAAGLAAFAGALAYFLQAWTYAHIQTVLFDEGGYLYSGLLFARGVLHPFQDNGLVRLYAPLAYLIPGKIETWFGAGLRTGRYLSIFCSLVMLAALWLTARRLGGKWLAAAIPWAMALTPISIQIYSLAITEALVACLLACSLAFVLGEQRRTWQIFSGSVLAGLAVMTRQNMIPLVALLTAYVFWQHGKRPGWWALAGCLLPILAIHAAYWPNILELWAVWLPARLTPFLDSYRVTSASLGAADGVGFLGRFSAFLQGIRFHYFTMVGFFVCLFLWPRRDGWKDAAHRRMATFLAALFFTLALVHAWASFIIALPAVSCTFCFTPYLAFFDVIVFLLVIVMLPSWKKGTSKAGQIAIIIFVLLLCAGIGYAAFDRIGNWVLNARFPAFNRGWDPRGWIPFISIRQILANKFHQDFWGSRGPAAALFGGVIGLAILALAGLIRPRLARANVGKGYSYGAFSLIVLLAAGAILSPLFGGAYRDKGICRADILGISEQMGQSVAESIPPNHPLYWASNNLIPLLYAPDRPIFTPQIYSTFYFRLGEDSKRLLLHGFWNKELAQEWLGEVSYIVAGTTWPERPDYPGDEFLTHFTQKRTLPANPCDPESYLIIYQKKP